MRVRPFEVQWTARSLGHLTEKVAGCRFPVAPADDGWRYGCDPVFLRQLCAYWAHGFDVEAAAATLNRHPQVIVELDELAMHAVHVVGEAEGRRPLLLTHGWPGSVFEFWQVIEPLAFPSRHGGRREDAFDLVIPSLPGFGFSGKPRDPVGVRAAAGLIHQVMVALGYSSYCAQGGDWGSGVAAWLALDHPEAVQAIHLNLLLVQPSASPETPEERDWKAKVDENQRQLGAYALLQGTRPQSLAYAMEGNPVAQAAWLIERFHDWADLRERPFEQVFSRDQLLTDVLIYLANDAFTTASWIYAGSLAENARTMPAGRRVEVPSAFAAYPDPRSPAPPRAWVERGYRLSAWAEQPRGGHFAAMEVPDLFVADLWGWRRTMDGSG